MILKNADDKQASIAELETLLLTAQAQIKPNIEKELKIFKAGISGENASSFYINDYFGKSTNCYIIHDLRIEHQGRVAQIDHLLLNRLLQVYVIETKKVHAGIKITDNGEFLRWDNYNKSYIGMESPIAQNERHIDILKSVFNDKIDVPSKLGIQLTPTFHSRILVSPAARIDRPKKFDTSTVIKADAFCKSYDNDLDYSGFFNAVSTLAKIISGEEVFHMGKQLLRMHKPHKTNYAAKFSIDKQAIASANNDHIAKQERVTYNKFICSKCKGSNLNIDYGRYGYYFKCKDCEGNTAIKTSCHLENHTSRLRKDGIRFYLDCTECKTSTLFFENIKVS